MKAHDCVPANVSAGGDTVGVRMPNHLLALELIKQCGVPLAAPSANRSESLSPTTVADVYRSLGELTPPILDGGPCLVGIESTVVDISGDVAAVLRPGAISRAQIAAVLGEEVMVGGQHTVARSPGQMIRHYAPATPAVLTALPEIEAMVHGRTALLCYSSSPIHTRAFCSVGRLPGEPEGYANGLYAILHELDRVGADLIIIETPPDTEEWTAIRDRLTRATAPIKSP
jgi:L-threonylcarbamoyladenylate synthase